MKIQKQFKNLLLIYFIVSILFSITIIFRCINNNSKNKILEKIINCKLENQNTLFSILWGLSHFIMYVLLGFYAPDLWYVSYSLSIIWELFEYIQEKNSVYIKYNYCDFFTNAIGLAIGVLLYNIYKKKNKAK